MDGNTLPPAGTPNFFVGTQDNDAGAVGDNIIIYKFHVDWVTPANSTFTGPATIPVAPFDSFLSTCVGRACIPQRDTANRLDHLGYRQRPTFRLAYRNFGTHASLVTNQSVEASPGMAGVRWYELRSTPPTVDPTLFQQGTFNPGATDGIFRWMGSIAMDATGNMALGYSASSANMFPSIWYTGRLASDPLGTMPQGEGVIVNGTGAQTSGGNRWGDYSSMNVDPVDGCTFWYTTEWVPTTSASGWRGAGGAFKFPNCSQGTPTPTVTGTPPTATRTPTRTNTPAVTPTCSPGSHSYLITTGTATIVAGTTDTGNHCDNCTTTIALPFSFTLYGQAFTSVTLDSNGAAMFPGGASTSNNACLPAGGYTHTIFPYWDDLRTNCTGCGIFTRVLGTAPNRTFVIEWRAEYFPGVGTANFELLFYEGVTSFETRIGVVVEGNTTATSGVQLNAGNFTEHFCNGAIGAAYGSQMYTLSSQCNTPVPPTTPTRTPFSTGTPPPSCTPPPARTYLAGVDDNFAPGNVELASPSQEQILYAQQNNLTLANFDGTAANRAFMHTFTVDLSGGLLCAATLQMRVRAICDLSENDAVTLGPLTTGDHWGSYLGTGYGPNHLLNDPWSCATTTLITLDLATLPISNYGTVLNMINATNGTLPVYIQDDTAVDFIMLTAHNCACQTATPTPTATLQRGSISGIIFAESITSTNVISGAYIFACREAGPCTTDISMTDADGHYTLDDLEPAQYQIHAFPARGSRLRPGLLGPINLCPGCILVNQHFAQLTGVGPPLGTSLSPTVTPVGTPDPNPDIPYINDLDWVHLETPGCPHPDPDDWAEYAVVAQDGTVLDGNTMTYNDVTGKWEAEIPPLAPIIVYYGWKYLNVYASIVITLHCVNDGDSTVAFDIYIDPSGYVRTVDGAGLSDATVTLYRASTPDGPFTIVPDGSAIMAPDNRHNPDITAPDGRFAWNVIAGYYRVRAEHPGCVDPDNPNRTYVESYIMQIPPPVTDLDLRLACGGPTPTPTACPIQFTDVPPGSTFYEYIRCMACRAIINGYSSGCETGNPCFRPNNNVTRGQLSKIVANAANFSDPPGPQQFEDVSVGSTFFDFIWRLANRGIVSGYPCGGPGEPCGPGNPPYFRPNANITRGQISKIVSEAAGLADPPGPQQFEDVPSGHTFYVWINRLVNLGVMSGYPCGGPGEPCGGGNLPYFRPGANATRGQASKIVANTFYPSCKTPNR